VSEEILEGGFARYRADNNYSNLSKASSTQDGISHGIAGAGIGGLAADIGVGLIINKKLKKISTFIPKNIPQKARTYAAQGGALIGGLVGSLSGLSIPQKKANIYKQAEDEASHFYITDVGVSVVPKKLGPADLTAAFHMQHPAIKYLPIIGSAAAIGGTLLSDSLKKHPHSSARMIAAATLGGGVGTLLKLYNEDKFLTPYKRPFIKQVEDKYQTKLSSEMANEYITETNIEMLPFHDTSPGDLDVAYRFKHPMGNYAPAVGTLLGIGGSLLSSKLHNKPISTVNTLMHGTIGGVSAALLEQIHKDRVLQNFKKPVLNQINAKYKQDFHQ
jgi:hypothetical protein